MQQCPMKNLQQKMLQRSKDLPLKRQVAWSGKVGVGVNWAPQLARMLHCVRESGVPHRTAQMKKKTKVEVGSALFAGADGPHRRMRTRSCGLLADDKSPEVRENEMKRSPCML